MLLVRYRPHPPGSCHLLFYHVVGRTLRGEEQYAEEVLVRALPRCHGRRISGGWRLRIALENGGDVLSMERQDDAKLVLVIPKMRLIFAVKMWAELQHYLDVVDIMLRHDVAPVIGYQTQTVELPSMLEITLLQAAMHYV